MNISTTTDSGQPRRRTRIVAGGALAAVLLAALPARWAVRLAAEPTGPKDCGPQLKDDNGTSHGVNDGKPTAIRLAEATAASLQWVQRAGTINDASCLNRTSVYGVVAVSTNDDVRNAIAFARAQGLKISAAGVRHSMGGHAFATRALILDMTRFNRMSLDETAKILTVQSGATWHDIQKRLHPRFAVKAMQSTDIFTVGGSISVNAHGMDHNAGSVGRTIRAMRVMLPNGSIVTASRNENRQLFDLVVGGYGLFGIILDVDLDVTDNAVYRSERRLVDYREFTGILQRDIQPDASYGLMYGHLSTAPQSLLREVIVYAYRTTGSTGAAIPPLGEVGQTKLRRLVFNLSKRGGMTMRLKWFAEKYVEPRLESCPVSRNGALGEGEACFVSRNDPMHDSVAYLRNTLPDETDILHEYFIPAAEFVPFVDGLRDVVRSEGANLLNASVRVVHREDNFLTYAPRDNMLAIVLYLNQKTDREGTERMASLTRRLIDLTHQHNGRFFLPYQLHYSAEQLERSYPNIREFFAMKRELDPDGLLTNTWYEKYSGG